MRYKEGDIVRATSTFSGVHIYKGHEYSVLRDMPYKETVFLDVPAHMDGEVEILVGYIELARRKMECMFK